MLEAHHHGLHEHVVRCCIYQLCKAMQFIHKQDIVYRDIKPENLLIDPAGTLKLCDFGFARKVRSRFYSLPFGFYTLPSGFFSTYSHLDSSLRPPL